MRAQLSLLFCKFSRKALRNISWERNFGFYIADKAPENRQYNLCDNIKVSNTWTQINFESFCRSISIFVKFQLLILQPICIIVNIHQLFSSNWRGSLDVTTVARPRKGFLAFSTKEIRWQQWLRRGNTGPEVGQCWASKMYGKVVKEADVSETSFVIRILQVKMIFQLSRVEPS